MTSRRTLLGQTTLGTFGLLAASAFGSAFGGTAKDTGKAFKGEDVKVALAGGQLPGTSYEQSRAYTNYIRRLQSGTSGFTCFASLQMPRG